LFIAAGLYLGFDFSAAFGFLIVGAIFCAFGLVLFVLQLMEPPTKPAATRLSPKFISAGSTAMMPAMSHVENRPADE
jgi:ABC-type phosphate transport system substrate-binding protein